MRIEIGVTSISTPQGIKIAQFHNLESSAIVIGLALVFVSLILKSFRGYIFICVWNSDLKAVP